jgi:hypothetical protein
MVKPDMRGWSPEQIKAYEDATAALVAEEATAERERAARAAAASSPEALVERLREQAEQTRQERERAAREAADDEAYRRAVAKHGKDHVARVRTVKGSVILRGMSGRQWEDHCDRIAGLDGRDEDIVKVSKEAVFETLEHPSRDTLQGWVEEFGGLWTTLYMARDALVMGLDREAGPKG